MKNRLQFLLTYLLFWLVFFIINKVIFLIYQGDQASKLQNDLIAGIFLNGLRMDLSFSAYLSAIPFLLVSFSPFVQAKVINTVIKCYTLVVLILMVLLSVIDLEIFRAWGFRMDATPLMYLNNPREMMASIGASPVLLLLLLLLGLILIFYFSYLKIIHPILRCASPLHWLYLPLFLLITAALIIPIRGGLQLAPINQSSAYFSTNNFANQVALNAPWNFFHSLSKGNLNKENPYLYMENPVAEKVVNKLYKKSDESIKSDFIKANKPNILIILWESLTTKTTLLYGREEITPAFTALTEEGILFSNFYASADRSDKGIVGVLSGYPAQPEESIIKIPKKSAKLPALTQDFNDAGYETAFYYGGEPEFANIKSYLVNSEFERIIGKEDFNEKDWNSKWGAHDHVVLEKVYHDLKKQQKPFFTVVFTLSSHEPFEIPIEPLLPGDDEETQFLNSHHYTDQAVGKFISKIKSEPWYDNTLVVILADHGHRLPGNSTRHEPEKFHIPMLWLGGALNVSDTVIRKVSSQTDFARTLLNQLQMNSSAYPWSKDIFNPSVTPFAQYVFNGGMGLVKEEGYVAFDNAGRQVIHQDAKLTEDDLQQMKAHLQLSYGDFLDK